MQLLRHWTLSWNAVFDAASTIVCAPIIQTIVGLIWIRHERCSDKSGIYYFKA
jgi:hypothetical protein